MDSSVGGGGLFWEAVMLARCLHSREVFQAGEVGVGLLGVWDSLVGVCEVGVWDPLANVATVLVSLVAVLLADVGGRRAHTVKANKVLVGNILDRGSVG